MYISHLIICQTDDLDLCGVSIERSSVARQKPVSNVPYLWPNPTSGTLQVFVPDLQAAQEVQLQVTDLSGRTVFAHTATTSDGHLAFNGSELGPGIYLLHLRTSTRQFSPIKLVIAR